MNVGRQLLAHRPWTQPAGRVRRVRVPSRQRPTNLDVIASEDQSVGVLMLSRNTAKEGVEGPAASQPPRLLLIS